MASKTLSDLVRYLASRGCDGVAALLFLLWRVEQTTRYQFGQLVSGVKMGIALSGFRAWGF